MPALSEVEGILRELPRPSSTPRATTEGYSCLRILYGHSPCSIVSPGNLPARLVKGNGYVKRASCMKPERVPLRARQE